MRKLNILILAALTAVSGSAMAVGFTVEQGKNFTNLNMEMGKSSSGLYAESHWLKNTDDGSQTGGPAIVGEGTEAALVSDHLQQADAQVAGDGSHHHARQIHRQLAPVHAAGEGILQTEDISAQHGGDGQQEGEAHGKPPLEAHEAAGGDGHTGAGNAGDRGDSLTDAHHQHIQHRGAAGILAALAGPVAEKQQEAGDDQGGADEYHTVLQALHRVLDRQDGKQGQRTQNDQQDQAAGRGYRRRGAVVDQITDAAEKFPHHVADVLPIGHEHRQQRTQMQQYVVESGDLGVDVQQILGDGQMAGAGDGQKFRHALNEAEKYRVKDRQKILLLLRGLVSRFCRRTAAAESRV